MAAETGCQTFGCGTAGSGQGARERAVEAGRQRGRTCSKRPPCDVADRAKSVLEDQSSLGGVDKFSRLDRLADHALIYA